MADERMKWIGTPCVFVDPTARPHDAVITAVHSLRENGKPWSVNLVHVSKDENSTDQYGRQIERKTSVPHKEMAGANGYYFVQTDELQLAG